ncbi:MAG: type II toxin-antitoxin system HicA family toxin [Verrucomicrobia bacterium]|nr:type II toxin-antitoxin system HicA family toxin [Verrucomicrobiota bacterium]
MGTKEKLIDRLMSLPSDFTFDEAARLLQLFGYKKENKGKTSGSRVMFIDEQKRKILLHKPHPGNILKKYALEGIIEKLIRNKNI